MPAYPGSAPPVSGEAGPSVARAQSELGRGVLGTTGVGDLHPLTGRLGADGHDQLVRSGDRLAVEGGDDVAGLQARLLRGAAGHDRAALAGLGAVRGDPRAAALVGHVDAGADDRMSGLAAADELLGDPLDLVARDREAQPDAAALLLVAAERLAAERGDRRVDPDHLALGVDERAAGVARVDRRVGLHRVDE